MRRNTKGFTLIELMIVVVVIAILAALAYPSYIEQVHKSRRADAMRAVSQLQLDLERWRSENPCYGTTGTPCPTFTASGTYPSQPTTSYYSFGITGATTTDYIVTASRAGTQSTDRCGNLVARRTLNNSKPTWANTACNG